MQNNSGKKLEQALAAIADERQQISKRAEEIMMEHYLFRKQFNVGKEVLERSRLGIYIEKPKDGSNISICWRHFVAGKPIEKSTGGGTKKVSLTKRINKGRGNAYTKSKLSRYARPGEIEKVMEFEQRLAPLRERLRMTSLAAKYIKKAMATGCSVLEE